MTTITAADRAEIVAKWSRYADNVKQLAAERRRGVSTSVRPVTPAGKTARSATTSRVRHRRFVFSALAMDALRDMPYDSGVEVGCGLYGVRHDNGDITVWAVGRTHTDDRMTRLTLDPQDLLDDGAHFLRGPGWSLVGNLHVHPHNSGDDIEASSVDRDAWRLSAYSARASYVGVVLGASSDEATGWVRPILKGWIAEPNGKVVPATTVYSWDEE